MKTFRKSVNLAFFSKSEKCETIWQLFSENDNQVGIGNPDNTHPDELQFHPTEETAILSATHDTKPTPISRDHNQKFTFQRLEEGDKFLHQRCPEGTRRNDRPTKNRPF